MADGHHSTPSFSHLTAEDYRDVYEPAEDSFLMMDALEKELDFIKERRPDLCVEVGCGTGALITFLASILGPFAHYIATDTNTKAADCTARTAKHNGVYVCPIVTDLVECLVPCISGKVDVLLFNPPYVVTPSEEVGSHGIEASWAGGKQGREVTDRLLPLVPQLLSRTGCFYLLVITENNPDEIIAMLEASGLQGSTVLKRRAGRERLSVLKFIWSKGSGMGGTERESNQTCVHK